MVRVYVHSKRQCPSDAVLREGPHGGKYYVPDERGKGAEVGGVMESFDQLFSSLEKERVYVDNPASVPPELEPQRGQYGGWYYERPDPQEDSVMEELIQMIADQILPEMEYENMGQEDFPSRVREEVQDRIQLSEVDKSEFINEVKDVMMKEESQKLRMERVYVGTEEEVPEPYEAQTDENGDMFYEVDDGVHIESGRETTPNKSVGKEYELREGLTWTENVMVTDIDEESGMVTMVDTEGASEWQEPIDEVEAKLESLETREHDWMYELIAGEYASLEEDEVHEVLHEAAGIDKGVRLDYETRLNKDEDPCWEGYTMVGTKDNGDPRCVPDDEVENYDADK
jgi:hypothetical protein